MNKAFFIVGPTASGKTSVAQYIAEREGRAVVSADSMNIYRGMDIGTAKPAAEERSDVDYVGFDLAEPTENFNVAAYLRAVRPAFASEREPIVAGGTGLYVKCLTEGFDDSPAEKSDLRAELEALDFHALEKRAKLEAAGLYERLTEDDRQNPRRLVRILEKEGAGNSKWNSAPKPVLVGLRVDRAVLLERIERRVDEMYASGLLEEARGLLELELSRTAAQAIGYAEAFAAVRGEMTEAEAKEKTIIRTRQLAKRQMTWFRNQLNVEWIDVAENDSAEDIAPKVSAVWEKFGPSAIQI